MEEKENFEENNIQISTNTISNENSKNSELNNDKTPSQVQEVLTTVSDQYLKNKRRKKITIISSILSVVLALSIAIITMASVKVNLKPFFIEEPAVYTVVISGQTKSTITKDNTEFAEFSKLMEKSFKINTLTALFTGKLGGYTINEGSPSQSFYSDSDTKSALSSSLINSLGDNYVRLTYNVDQTMFKSNGKAMYSSYDRSKELCYVDVVFPISSENTENELTFYFGTYYNTTSYISTITISANTHSLYDYIVNGK